MQPPKASTVRLHLSMLNDRTRTGQYLTAIRELVRPNDVVLDLGTGTGILAIAAARAGARHVYALEGGTIAALAARIVEENGLSQTITVIPQWSNLVTLPERPTLLVTELIGNELLGEGLVAATVDARRRLLTPEARFIPSSLRLYCLPINIPEQEIANFAFTQSSLMQWQQWYDGISFHPLLEACRSYLLRSFVNPWSIRDWPRLGKPALLYECDLSTVETGIIDSETRLQAECAGHLSGLLMFFEAQLSPNLILSTDPAIVEAHNHWLSPLWIAADPVAVRSGDAFVVRYYYNADERVASCELRPVLMD